METELIIVRHGETDWNSEHRLQGQRDTELNQLGREQAEKVSDYLAGEEFEMLFSSDLRRAVQTAEVIASPHGLSVQQEEGLREINFGEWEGLSYSEIRDKYPDTAERWFADPTSTHPPGGEWLEAFQERVVNGFAAVLTRAEGKRAVVVSHGGSIRVYLAHLLGMPVALNWRLAVGNCALSIVRFIDGVPSLRLFNFNGFLDDQNLS